jgi:hypothetical protein
MMGTSAAWYGLRNAAAAAAGENKPVIRPPFPDADVDWAGRLGNRALLWWSAGWLLFATTAALDGNLLHFGVFGVVVGGAVAGFVLVAMGLMPAVMVSRLVIRRYLPGALRPRPAAALVGWLAVTLVSLWYGIPEVKRCVSVWAWERFPVVGWDFDFGLTVRAETFASLGLTLSLLGLAAGLLGIVRALRAMSGRRHAPADG